MIAGTTCSFKVNLFDVYIVNALIMGEPRNEDIILLQKLVDVFPIYFSSIYFTHVQMETGVVAGCVDGVE